MAARSILRKSAFAIVAAWACLLSLPFIGQPLHLDDYFYLDIAENALHNPLFAQDMPYVFEGERFQDLASHSHPPLVSYYLALALVAMPDALGEATKFHLAFGAFPIIIGLSTYSLARAFSPYPLLVAMLTLAAPVVMVNSHTLIADVPTLAFYVLAMAAIRNWLTQRRLINFSLTILVTTLTSFTNYLAL